MGNTALVWARWKGHTSIFLALIDAGASQDIQPKANLHTKIKEAEVKAEAEKKRNVQEVLPLFAYV